MSTTTEVAFSHIELVEALKIKILETGPTRVRLLAPLVGNRNDKNTVFAGSSSSVGTLACWALVDQIVNTWAVANGKEKPLAFAKEVSIQYKRVITSDFVAECTAPSVEKVQQFLLDLEANGKAAIDLESITCEAGNTQTCVYVKGNYVALCNFRHPRASQTTQTTTDTTSNSS
ncbi:putative thioesterase [Pelomyxa schiedti]|nr:putative thioesterase [Pelomyxa schiedti]